MTAPERVDYRGQITALVPDYAHRVAPTFNPFGTTTWTWTTSAGTWSVAWGGFDPPVLRTPFGRLTLSGEPDVAFGWLVGVLVTLGGVEATADGER
jgi:hypothetical protein